MPGKGNPRCNFRMDKETRVWLDKYAAANGVTKSDICKELLLKFKAEKEAESRLKRN